MQVPVSLSINPDLDELKLRGRKVAAKDAGLLFGPLTHQFFQVYIRRYRRFNH